LQTVEEILVHGIHPQLMAVPSKRRCANA
jgi:hypothetical protein